MSRDIHTEFEKLARGFARYRRMADKLVTPNPEDDDLIRAAIVGFSFYQPTESWERSHYGFVRGRLDTEFRLEAMAWYEDKSHAHRLFAALCLGYLLGLYQSGELSDEEFSLAEARLPGFMLQHTDRIAP